MGKEYTEIDEGIHKWIERQHVFFVATAPLSDDGLINCSPKGLDSLRILGPKQLAYVDTGGSGVETVAHVRENQRIVLMLCAFEGPPKIYRFYGNGAVIDPYDDKFAVLLAHFPQQPTVRNIILIDVERIIDSCGYGVPLYEFKKHRDSLSNWAADKTDKEVLDYRKQNNRVSLDGLPGLDFPED